MPYFTNSILHVPYRTLILVGVAFLVLCACGPAAEPAGDVSSAPAAVPDEQEGEAAVRPGSCGLADAAGATNEEAIRAVLRAEGELVVAQDVDDLMRLWSVDGTVTDAKNTPRVADDDQVWTGKDAIRHRYVRIVFPGAPAAAEPADLDIAIDGAQATITATTQIGDEVSPQGDRWRLVQQDGCWLIESLTYNLEQSD